MNQGLVSSLLPTLAAPWRQRRNTGSMWGTLLVVGLLALAPALLFGWSLFVLWGSQAGPPSGYSAAQAAADMRHAAGIATQWALAALALAMWGVTVSNVLDQNRPVLARLVPGHPARLRLALVTAWGAGVAFITLAVGLPLGEPLLCATLAAPSFAFLAASVRWPLLWMLGCVAPFVVNGGWQSDEAAAAVRVLVQRWHDGAFTIFAPVAAASSVLLLALIQGGGTRHIVNDAARRQRQERFRVRAIGAQPAATGTRGHLQRALTGGYTVWFRHMLSRPGRSAFGRLMLGLGPGIHWTAGVMAFIGIAFAGVAGVALLQALAAVFPSLRYLAPSVLGGVSVGLMPGLLASAMQVQARLHQTRREQALLALAPGVPRGAALSRRLSWQLTLQFAGSWLGAMALMMASYAAAQALGPEFVKPQLLVVRQYMAIAAVPLVVLQWRHWARMPAPSSLNALGPLLLAGLVIALCVGVPAFDLMSLEAVAASCIAAALAWCAMRWWRMGHERSPLPVGRLA
jgi:hypothetical protein